MSRHNRDRRSAERLDRSSPRRNGGPRSRGHAEGRAFPRAAPAAARPVLGPIDRRAFLLANHDRAESSYTQACNAGFRDAVIVIVDSHDGLGRQLTARLREVAVTTNLFGGQHSRIRPSVLFALERKAAFETFALAPARTRQFLAMPAPVGMFHVLAVADDGVLSVFLPAPGA